MQYVSFKKDAKYDLIAMGRIAIDFNPIDYFKTLAESKEYRKYLGGSPANVAVGLARLGKKVGFVARVSDDRFGDYVTDFFAKEGIDVSHVKRAEHGEKLGLTFTEILSSDESSILMYRDGVADLSLDPSDVDEEYIASAKALLISGTALAQSPSREACLKAMQLAEKNDVRIIFDIDYRAYNWKSADEIAVYYTAVAEHADIIMGSREEYDLTQAISLPGADDAKTAAHWFAHNAKIVIIKHGKEGSEAHTCDGKRYKIKPFPVKAFKSFGGGDGYGSAFLSGLFDGKEIIDCLELGSASASMLVAAHGCSEFMPTQQELLAFIDEKKKQYGEMVARG